jgi:hypothetical protein
MALQKQTLSIPVSQGIDTKTDEKQVPAGKALALENVRFQKTGKLSKRFGLVALPTASNIADINTTTINALVSDNSYLSAFTNKGVFAFSQGDQSWYNQSILSTLAKISTDNVLDNFFNQSAPDMDITSDGTHAAYVYTQQSTSFATNLSVCLEDLSTGLKKYATVVLAGVTPGLQRVIIVKDSGAVKVHVFYYDGTNLVRNIYNFNMIAISVGTVITTMTSASRFDLCKDASNIYLVRMTTTNLSLFKYDYAGTQLLTTSNTVTLSLGLALTIYQTTNNIHVAWTGALTDNAIKGFNKSLVATIPEVTFAGGLNDTKITMCENSAYPNFLFLFADTDTTTPQFKYSVIGFSVSAYSAIVPVTYYRCALASQPFAINGKTFVVLRSYDFNNKSFFLFNALESYICQKLSTELAIKLTEYSVSKTIVINNVAKTLITRRSIDATSDNLSSPSAALVNLDFNNNYADNSRVVVGGRIYLTNGATIECDKTIPTDNGFVFNPVMSAPVQVTGVANPNIASKTFSYVVLYEYKDSAGNITRSAPSAASSITTTSTAQSITVSFRKPLLSLKAAAVATTLSQQYSAVLYRTKTLGSVYFRCQELILTVADGDFSSFSDTASDSDISDNETIYTTGGVLQNDSAPAAKFSTAGGNRIFLGGLEEKDEVAFSKRQLYGESVAFSDFFRIRVSSGTSADKTQISALGYMDGKLIIFRQQSIYFLQGDGPSELGDGSFSEPEIISSDAGCIEPRSVINTPMGLMFKSRKGIYILTRGLAVEYIGAEVEDFNSANVCASILSDKYNEVRFYLTTGDCLVYNYLFQSWSIFKNQTAVDADVWQNSPVSVISNTIFKETENTYLDNGSTGFYSMKYISPWLRLDLIQGYVRCYQLWIIGSYKSPHTLKCRVYVDYDSSVFDEYSLIYSNTESPQYQFTISLPRQKVESIKFEIFDTSHQAASNGEAYDLSNIQVEIGMKAGGYKLAANKSF